MNRAQYSQKEQLIRQGGFNYTLLTAREIEVLQCVADGMTNKDIAERFSIAVTTVNGHMENVVSKLHAKNRTHAAVTAVRTKLIA